MSTSESSWHMPPGILFLGSDEVHAWRAMLDLPEFRVLALEQTLSADEQTRARKFRFQKDRRHFIVARGLLRAILGRYLDKDPAVLHFSYNQYGKPALAEGSGGDTVSFNLAHSHGLALYAITRSWAIGIDLEYMNMDIECELLAERFFSPYEVTILRSVPKSLQHQAFFNCWTRKEAYIKARGMGLSLDLDLFDVSLTPGAPAAILASREENQDASRWSLYELSPGESYAAALAVEGHPAQLKYWQWPES